MHATSAPRHSPAQCGPASVWAQMPLQQSALVVQDAPVPRIVHSGHGNRCRCSNGRLPEAGIPLSRHRTQVPPTHSPMQQLA